MRDRKEKRIARVKFTEFGIECMEVRQPSLVDSFTHIEREDEETGVKTYTYHHPLYMLFNQERIDRLGQSAIEMWLKQLEQSGNSARNELKSKISDSDLMKVIKPRNIQSPSDLESWLNHLNERADVFNKEVARIVAEEKEAIEKTSTTETTNQEQLNTQ